MPKTVRRTACTLMAAALLVLTGQAVTTAVAAGHGGRQVASSVRTLEAPCASCGG